MDIKFNNIDTYEITLKEGINWSICCNNITSCKQHFLDYISAEFDRTVNKKLGDYGFIKKK